MSVIKRYLEPDDLFEASLDDLSKIYKNIRTTNPKPNAGFWDMQFRKNNNVTLYYKSCAFNFQLENDEAQHAYKFKLKVSDSINKSGQSLKKYLIKAVEDELKLESYEKKYLIDNLNKGGIYSKEYTFSDFFKKYKEVFETAVNKSYYGEDKNNQERKVQQYLAAALESDERIIMLDYEVVVENIDEDISKTILCRNHGEHKAGDYKKHKETDLLLLKQSSDGKYKFIPVELKMSGSSECGICQVSTYTNIIKKYIGSFSENYSKVIEQKIEVGILNDSFKILKEENIDTRSVDEVYIGIIFNNNVSYENAEKKCVKIREKSLRRKEYLSGKKLKIIPIILGENDEENRNSINNFVKEIQ